MLMLWMCCLSFAQEEKNELGLLLGVEFIPRAATTSNQKLSVGRSVAYSVDYACRLSSGSPALLLEFPLAAGPSHRVDSAQLNAITSLATLCVTPSLRAQFVSHAPVSPWLSGGFGYGLYEGSSALQNGVTNTEIHRNVATAQFGGGIDARTRVKLLFTIGLRGEFGDFYTLGTPVSAFRFCAQNSMISSSREVWSSTFSRLRRGRPLVNMEDRMFDRLAYHERQCQDGSQEGHGKADFFAQRHWPLSPASGRPVPGTPGVPQDQQRNQCGGSRNE